MIRGARQLLTLGGAKGPRRGTDLNELGIIPDGSLLIRDGVLDQVGPGRRVENLAVARGALEIQAAGRVVMPGFVDSHTHLIYPPPVRGYVAGDGQRGATQAIRTSSARLLEMRLRPFLDAMARHGTTTLEVQTGCGPDESAEVKALRVLAALDGAPLDVVRTFLLRIPGSAGEAEAEQIVREFPPRIYRRRLARFAGIWWDGESSHAECDSRYLAEASARGLPSKVHAEGPGCAGAVPLAVGYGAATVDHLEHLGVEQTEFLAGARTMATLLPAAALYRGGPMPPARALIDSGAAVALASDFNPRHAPVFNMQMVISLACLQLALTPAEAISAATINGAHALGCAALAGSLEPGKRADVLILNLDDYRDMGFHMGANLVHATIKRGQCIYREGAVKALVNF